MTTKTRDDIFLEKLARLLQENRIKGGGMPKQNRTPEISQQRMTTNHHSEDFRKEPRKREV
jgi:hypothetical protein